MPHIKLPDLEKLSSLCKFEAAPKRRNHDNPLSWVLLIRGEVQDVVQEVHILVVTQITPVTHMIGKTFARATGIHNDSGGHIMTYNPGSINNQKSK